MDIKKTSMILCIALLLLGGVYAVDFRAKADIDQEDTWNIKRVVNISGVRLNVTNATIGGTLSVAGNDVCLEDGTNCPATQVDYQSNAGGWSNNSTTTRTGLNVSIINLTAVRVNEVLYPMPGNATDIQAKLDACNSLGCEVRVAEGTYMLTSSLVPKNNTRIVFSPGALMVRDPSFKNTSNDHLIALNGSRQELIGGRWNGNNVTASSSLHFVPIYVGGKNILIDRVEVFNLGNATDDGDDAGIFIAENATEIVVTNSYVHHNYFAHGYQISGSNVMIANSVAEDIAQDGFRTYDGVTNPRNVFVINSIAIRTRAGFQCWSQGQRGASFIGDAAINSSTYGFVLAGIGCQGSGLTAWNSNITSLYITGSLNTVDGLYANGLNSSGYFVTITGNKNVINKVMIENGAYSTLSAVNVTGDDNIVSESQFAFMHNPINDTGSRNSFFNNKNPPSHEISDTLYNDLTIQRPDGSLNLSIDSDDNHFYIRTNGSTRIRVDPTNTQLSDPKIVDNDYLEFGNQGILDAGVRWLGANDQVQWTINGTSVERSNTTLKQLQTNVSIAGTLDIARNLSAQNITALRINEVLYVQSGNATDIQTKLNMCSQSGCKVVIPNGNYSITTTIIIGNNTVLEGSGPGTVLWLSGGVNDDVISNYAGVGEYNFTPYTRNVIIRNLRVEGNSSGQSGTNIHGIKLENVDGFIIEDVIVNDSLQANFALASSRNGLLIGTVSSQAGIEGYYFTANSSNIVLSNCQSSNEQDSVNIKNLAHRILVQGCIFKESNRGIFAWDNDNSSTRSREVIITNNVFDGSQRQGVYFNGCDNCVASFNYIFDASKSSSGTYDAILADNNSTGLTIAGNIARDSQSSPTTRDVVRLADGTSGSVYGNVGSGVLGLQQNVIGQSRNVSLGEKVLVDMIMEQSAGLGVTVGGNLNVTNNLTVNERAVFGATNPQAGLVTFVTAGNNDFAIRRNSGSAGQIAGIGFVVTSSSTGSSITPEAYIGLNRTNFPASGDGEIILFNNNTPYIFISPEGNLGIKKRPSDALEVDGNTNVSGNVSFNNALSARSTVMYVDVNGSKKIDVDARGKVTLWGTNTNNSNYGTVLNLISTADIDDGTGARRRAVISLWSTNDTSDLRSRGLSIESHKDLPGSQPHHVTFYSNLFNVTSAKNKAIEWQWGTNTTGELNLIGLNRIVFPENFTGYFDDQPNDGSGIFSNDEIIKIFTDYNNDDAAEQIILGKGSEETPFANFTSANINFYKDLYLNMQSLYQPAYIEVGNGTNPVGGLLMKFNTARAWNLGTGTSSGASTNLQLSSTTAGKRFIVRGTNESYMALDVFVQDNPNTPNSVTVDGNMNITGTLMVNGSTVCLSNGTNCLVTITPYQSSAGGWVNQTGNVSLANPANNVSAGSLFIDNTNNRTGIGTRNPNSPVEVQNASGTTIFSIGDLGNTTIKGNLVVGNNSWLVIRDNSGGNGAFQIPGTGSFDFGSSFRFRNAAGNTEFVRITSAGVGIFTNAAPTQALQVNGNISVNGSIIGPRSVDFNNTSDCLYAEGRVCYDPDEEALSYYNDEPEVRNQIGRENWARVNNPNATSILNGEVVYICGVNTTTSLPQICRAISSDFNKSRVLGIATHTIESGTNGYVTTFGEVNGVNTTAWPNATILYLSPMMNGSLTDVRPSAPNMSVAVAQVVNSSLNGTLFVFNSARTSGTVNPGNVPYGVGQDGSFSQDATFRFNETTDTLQSPVMNATSELWINGSRLATYSGTMGGDFALGMLSAPTTISTNGYGSAARCMTFSIDEGSPAIFDNLAYNGAQNNLSVGINFGVYRCTAGGSNCTSGTMVINSTRLGLQNGFVSATNTTGNWTLRPGLYRQCLAVNETTGAQNALRVTGALGSALGARYGTITTSGGFLPATFSAVTGTTGGFPVLYFWNSAEG